MADYLHGAYGRVQTAGTKAAAQSMNAIVYVGTAPVHNLAGGAANLNKPQLVQDMGEARRLYGYSDEWDKYTLCEAMYAHLEMGGVGPLVLINVLDPKTHKAAEGGTANLTPANGRVVIAAAQDIILDSVTVPAKVKGTDYAIAYDATKKTITITELSSGGLGTAELAITYDTIDPAAVDEADVIGSSDGAGLNTGLYAVKNVYQLTGRIPTELLVPGFSSIPEVHDAMYANSQQVNGHWNVYMRVDIPIVDAEDAAVTLATAAAWKAANGYNKPNETVYFPMVKGTDGRNYHLSVLYAANLQALLIEQDGIPYKTASNTACAIIQNLYLGADSEDRVYDDQLINELLNKNGIASAAFVGGRWAIWGCHSADYNQTDADEINVFETARMMLYYITNDFQHRRGKNSDKPMTPNDLKAVASEEQTRLDALVKIGALTYGEVLTSGAASLSDVVSGDYAIQFNVTTTPLGKSLTAIVNWTDDGYAAYFA